MSKDMTHKMSHGIDSIAKTLRRRRNTCVLFAQVANTEVAQRFWRGRLTQTRRASMINALISVFNEHHEIYEDTTDMAIIYD